MDNIQKRWITPFGRQVFIVIASAINMGQLSLINGFTARLLPQLRRPDSLIPVDDSSASWIASTFGITLAIGNILIVYVMGKFGRCPAGILSNLLLLIGWIWMSVATSTTSIIIIKAMQGLALGMASCVATTVIGEYSSPKNRAAFLVLSLFIFALITLIIHVSGSYLAWDITAFIAACVTFGDLVMLMLIPESPSWLADKGKYEECRKVFRSIRGDDEDDELDKLIEASKSRRNNKLLRSTRSEGDSISSKLTSCLRIVRLREFYVPMFIMTNMYAINQWSGLNILIGFTEDLLYWIVGSGANFGLHIFLMDLNRLFTCLIGVYLTKKFRRRLLLTLTVGANIVTLILIAMFSYAKSNNLISFEAPLIGVILAHLLVIFASWGASTFSVTLASEILPLEFRSLMAGLCKMFHSINLFAVMKSFGFFLKTIGLHGAFCVYAIISGVCLCLVLKHVPETKDKTLQQIEDEIKGKVRQDENLPTSLLTTQTIE